MRIETASSPAAPQDNPETATPTERAEPVPAAKILPGSSSGVVTQLPAALLRPSPGPVIRGFGEKASVAVLARKQPEAREKAGPEEFALRSDDTALAPEDLVQAVITPVEGKATAFQVEIGRTRFRVEKATTPTVFEQVRHKKATFDDLERSQREGYRLAAATDDFQAQDIVKASAPDDLEIGLVRFETTKGEKIIVSSSINSGVYVRVQTAAAEDQAERLKPLRAEFGLPEVGALSLLDQETTVLADEKDPSKGRLTLGEATLTKMVETYRKGIEDKTIATDDPRAKFVRLFEAQSALTSGRYLTGYEEEVLGSGGTMRKSHDRATLVSAVNLRELIDGAAVDNAVGALFENETILNDYNAQLQAGLATIDRAGLEQRLEQVIFGKDSRYIQYIDRLKTDGMAQTAEADIRSLVQTLRVLNPARADEAAAKLKTDAMTMELNRLVANPDLVSQENQSLAASDVFALVKALMKNVGLDLPRHTVASYERFYQEVIQNKQNMAELIKVNEEAKEKAAQNGGTLKPEDIENFKAAPLLKNKPGFVGFVATMHSLGVLGSLSSGLALISGIYGLIGKGGALADTPLERIAIAKDFITVLGATDLFVKTGDAIMGALHKKGSMFSLLGLDKTLPEIWKKAGATDVPGAVTAEDAARAGSPADQRNLERGLAQVHGEIGQAAEGLERRASSPSATAEVRPSAAVDAMALESATAKISAQAAEDAKANPAKAPGTAAKIGQSVLRVLGSVTDVAGGILDLVQGGLNIRNALKSGDPLTKAAGALQLAGGSTSIVAGGLGLGSAFGAISSAIGSIAAPLFWLGAGLGLIGALIGMFVGHKKKQKATTREGDWYGALAKDGLTRSDWGTKLEYLRYSIYRYGEVDAPADQSVFHYQAKEWEYFRTTEPKDGSSSNRLDIDKHMLKEMNGFGDAFYAAHREVIDRIQTYWDNWNGRDSFVGEKDLRKIAADDRRPVEERQTAQFLLDQTDLRKFLDISAKDDGEDGKISSGDLDIWLARLRGQRYERAEDTVDPFTLV